MLHSKNADSSCSLPGLLCLPCVVLYIGAAERNFTCSSHFGDAGSIANKSISKTTVVAWLFPFLFILAFFLLGWGRGNKKKKSRLRSGFPEEFEEKVQVFSSGLCTNTLFQTGNPSVPASTCTLSIS